MSDNKTEQPTSKKLRDARKKGQVPKSKELPSAAVIIGMFTYIWVGWDFILKRITDFVLLPIRYFDQPFESAMGSMWEASFSTMIWICLPALIIVITMGIAANVGQVGFMFAFDSVKPDLKKLNPVEGAKKIFSIDNLFELFKSIIKIAVLGGLLYVVIRDSLDPLVKIPQLGIQGVMIVLPALLKQVVIYTCLAFLLIGVADLIFQKKRHVKKLMMTKDEVKREYKEMQGDPLIKSKRKAMHKEMAMNDQLEKVRKATVLITNPTHLAVAVYYDREESKLPVILTKGADLTAKKMIAIAEEEGIPVMQNIPLARSLYSDGEVDRYIPSELIKPVAEVLRWVRSLEQQSRKKDES